MQGSNSGNEKISVFEIKKIWDDLRNDDSGALNKLFYKFYDDLYFYGTKLCKDNDQITDSIQEVFIYLWESRKSLSNVSHVKSYIFKIFRNKIFKAKASSKIYSLFPNNEQINHPNFEISQEDLLIEQELNSTRSELILNILNELTPKQREILYLKYYCNLSNTEISEALSIEKQSVSNLLNRSFHFLRKKLKPEDFFILFNPLILSQLKFF
jgi:RNA polymerase sigma factor (sigma-70 family)